MTPFETPSEFPPETNFPLGYQVLRSLSTTSPVYLCSERATGRWVVLKFFAQGRAPAFAQEAKTLDYLSAFDGSPLLYFACQSLAAPPNPPEKSIEHAYYIGIEYLAGKSLAQLRGSLSRAEIDRIGALLRGQVARLHGDFRIAHGDISPKNILVAASRDAIASSDRIVLVDWEFAVRDAERNVNHYNQFRGTVGFAEASDLRSLQDKDLRGVEACIAFLTDGIGNGDGDERAPPASRRTHQRWFRWIWARNFLK